MGTQIIILNISMEHYYSLKKPKLCPEVWNSFIIKKLYTLLFGKKIMWWERTVYQLMSKLINVIQEHVPFTDSDKAHDQS